MQDVLLEEAIRLAAEWHKGQLDKGGRPYIFHLLRVCMKGLTLEEQIVGVLHDAIEDAPERERPIRIATISAKFGPDILQAICVLTHTPNEDYLTEYIPVIARHALARRVKLHDLEDNMNLTRLPQITPNDMVRFHKYQTARDYLSVHGPENA